MEEFLQRAHELLWKESELGDEGGMEHFAFFLGFIAVEPIMGTLALPDECRWSEFCKLDDQVLLYGTLDKALTAFHANSTMKPFFMPKHGIFKDGLMQQIVQHMATLSAEQVVSEDVLGQMQAFVAKASVKRVLCEKAVELAVVLTDGIFREDDSLCSFVDPACGDGETVISYLRKAVELCKGKKDTDWWYENNTDTIHASGKDVHGIMMHAFLLTGVPFKNSTFKALRSAKEKVFSGLDVDIAMTCGSTAKQVQKDVERLAEMVAPGGGVGCLVCPASDVDEPSVRAFLEELSKVHKVQFAVVRGGQGSVVGTILLFQKGDPGLTETEVTVADVFEVQEHAPASVHVVDTAWESTMEAAFLNAIRPLIAEIGRLRLGGQSTVPGPNLKHMPPPKPKAATAPAPSVKGKEKLVQEPAAKSKLDDMTLKQLNDFCKAQGYRGYTRMKKDEIIPFIKGQPGSSNRSF